MSYSFQIRGATKAAAKVLIAIELDKVVASQAVHARDRAQAQAVGEAFVDLLPDDETQGVSVTMNGSLSGDWSGGDLQRVTGAAVGVSAGLTAKVAA